MKVVTVMLLRKCLPSYSGKYRHCVSSCMFGVTNNETSILVLKCKYNNMNTFCAKYTNKQYKLLNVNTYKHTVYVLVSFFQIKRKKL